MPLLPDLSIRVREDEVMDDPSLDAASHHAALRGLRRINALSRPVAALWPAIAQLAAGTCGTRDRDRPLRILDVACGAGDVTIGLWRRARRAGVAAEVHGCDVSQQALEFARQAASRRHAEVRFFAHDALGRPLPDSYDVIVSCLFLHHLEEDRAVAFLRAARLAARRMVLVNDLERCRIGFLLAYGGTRVLTRSPVVHVDGPRSVRAAFTTAEARALAQRAGLADAEVRPCWPWRWLLIWKRR